MDAFPPGQRAVCIWADADGESRLFDIALPVSRKVTHADGTAEWLGICGATGFGIADAASGGNHADWHISGMPGLSVLLEGAWEIEASNGERRLLEPGSVLVMLDNHGRGHRAHTHRQPCTTMGVSFNAETTLAMRALAEAAANKK